MYEVHWQSTTPLFNQFKPYFDGYPQLPTAMPAALQPRLTHSVLQLLNGCHGPKLLTVVAPDEYDYFELLTLLLQDASADQNLPIISAHVFDEIELFGALYCVEGQNKKVTGLLHHADNGIMLLSLTPLLANPMLWLRLKSVLATGKLKWKPADPKQYTLPTPDDNITARIVLIADREMMAEFEQLEPQLHQIATYSEFEQDVALDETNINQFLATLKYYQHRWQLNPFDSGAIKTLMQAGARYCEDKQRMPLCPLWLKKLLVEANSYASNTVTAAAVEKALMARQFRESYLQLRALDDIHNGQVFIDTDGQQIGQVNGLTVIDIAGHPRAYGEPARISCVVHLGDGDITDVERKAELAGNIHAKGMMIMQAFISAALDLDEPLPYSASIVFEQSYCEVDGDSASVAELCALVSALAQVPINQSIAITGAVDQFGRVQAVGGINEKIEGFYSLCAARGLTGTQGVILPKSNLQGLCLEKEVVTAIKQQKFHLWAIEHVEHAFPLLTGMAFSPVDSDTEEEEEAETLLGKIAERIANVDSSDLAHNSLIDKLKSWF